jgi:integrase
MTKRLCRLTARTVANEKRPGRHADGGNLYLAVSASGAKRWVFLYEYKGRQREAGLGSVTVVSLARAREKAVERRSTLAEGIDPLAAKQSAPHVPTFGEAADQLIASKRSGWRSSVHALQWETTLETHCKEIKNRRINELGTEDVLRVLTPIWQRIPETASRLRGRLEMVFDFAKARKWRSGENPAVMKGNLAHVLPRRPKIAQPHFAAMPYQEVPEFVASLREPATVASFALEFLILTAARSGEVRGACWSEIDFDAKVWTIPAERMKGGSLHRIPLVPRSLEILHGIQANGDALIFCAKPGRAMEARNLRDPLPAGVTVHGFRSSFRDWAGEVARFPREIAEEALAHATGNAVERAYRRGDALEQRRELMLAWARFCDPTVSKNVVAMRIAQ